MTKPVKECEGCARKLPKHEIRRDNKVYHIDMRAPYGKTLTPCTAETDETTSKVRH